MAILDKLRGVGEAVRDKVKETFGEPSDTNSEDADDDDSVLAAAEPALDPAGAYAALGLSEGATLADVRDAYRTKARQQHPLASLDGVNSEAQRTLDRLLEALELLEEQLVPLTPHAPGVTPRVSAPPPRRKRATARKV